jgi:hypothetical protein
MLPQFPLFKPIELEDWSAVEALTHGFAPYAEFNFVELWSWNSRDLGGWSCLNGNLVVRWHDVITGDRYLTFIGKHRVVETAETLIEFAIDTGIEPRLHAIPLPVIQNGQFRASSFEIDDDPKNWDYLLSTLEWSTISGARFKNKRNAIHRLERNHRPELREIDLSLPENQADIRSVTTLWAELRHRSATETSSEFSAINNLLTFAEERSCNRLYALGAYVGDLLIGFSINEELRGGYAIGHFAKADYRYEGIYPYLLRQVARHMRSKGIDFLNIEADLGDAGLATAKHLCYPIDMLRKYTIARKHKTPKSFRPVDSAQMHVNGGATLIRGTST